MTDPDGMVIIGGGVAGWRAASTLRQQGWPRDITMVMREDHLPYDRPPLSKEFITDAETPTPYLTNQTEIKTLDVSVHKGDAAVAIDCSKKQIELSGGETLGYHKLLLATGAVPRRLTIPGNDSDRVLYLRTIADSIAIRQRLKPGVHLIVVGGGFIGLEVAASARKRGAEVTIIEAMPRVLSRGVPEEIAAVVAAQHLSEDVKINCDAPLAALTDDGQKITAILADGRKISGDFVVAGIGAIPNTTLAQEAGLATDNGITVDEFCATSDPNIYAAGDCVSFPVVALGGARVRLESWRNAQDQGAVAATNMLGNPSPHTALPWFWSDQYDLSLQITGLPAANGTTVRRDLENDAFILFHYDTDNRLTGASGIGTGNAVARDIRLTEMLIAKGISPPESLMADAAVSLKKLLKA